MCGVWPGLNISSNILIVHYTIKVFWRDRGGMGAGHDYDVMHATLLTLALAAAVNPKPDYSLIIRVGMARCEKRSNAQRCIALVLRCCAHCTFHNALIMQFV